MPILVYYLLFVI